MKYKIIFYLQMNSSLFDLLNRIFVAFFKMAPAQR